ncbi:Pentatricopeptide repeat-containing protein [Acorus gramineus]|uniref:Pentatricopeptide repeat-containing protein n=1 Tax=Acorus gramineus TaxID=55184 RepID=A0AAV9BDV2_ACOGR|nr:Pentatricopeptide repeat-containing protein [Acorus gramineus]
MVGREIDLVMGLYIGTSCITIRFRRFSSILGGRLQIIYCYLNDHLHLTRGFSAASACREPILSEDLCVRVLSLCNSRSFKDGLCVHSPVVKLGLQDHLPLNNLLISLYSKCSHGAVPDRGARHLFDAMRHRDVVSWTANISAHTSVGDHKEALRLFKLMESSGCQPNEFTFASALRSCSSLCDLDWGIRLHARILKCGLEPNPVLGSGLMNLYSKCGEVDAAFEIFATTMHNGGGDTISWTTMISAFVQAGDSAGALRLYTSMIESGIRPNEFTFTKLLTASVSLGSYCAEMVHAHVILWGAKLNLVLKTALVDRYTKLGRMEDALRISRSTRESDVMLLTSLISGYTRILDPKNAVAMFLGMDAWGVTPNAFTYAAVLSACSMIPDLRLGAQIHCRVMKAGLECNVSVGNALIDMYTKCSPYAKDAVFSFDKIISPNVVSWTSLIAGLSRHGLDQDAYMAFTGMRAAGIGPNNSFTLSTILKACGSIEEARRIHAYMLKIWNSGDDDETRIVGNSLVDAYARMQSIDDAWLVIDTMMPHRDAITYTSMATALNQMGLYESALGIIKRMSDDDSVKMDGFSISSFLSASASLTAMEPGKQLHCHSVKSGLDLHISVSNGLIDLYAKCGGVEDARRVFSMIPQPNVVSWNGLISGLASNGLFKNALSSFEDMRIAGVQPDNITFLLVIYACSHGGLVDLGLHYFDSISKVYGMAPLYDHYVCLVDLLGRGGRLEDAIGQIEGMPFPPDALIYKTLLSSCKVHKNLVLGEHVANRAMELDPYDPAIYVLLAGIYDDAGKSSHSKQTWQMMMERRLRKVPGQSWIEIRNRVYVFTSGDRSNPQIDEIHKKIMSLEEDRHHAEVNPDIYLPNKIHS